MLKHSYRWEIDRHCWHFSDDISKSFSSMKSSNKLHFDSDFTGVYSSRPSSQQIHIDSGNGFAPSRRQATLNERSSYSNMTPYNITRPWNANHQTAQWFSMKNTSPLFTLISCALQWRWRLKSPTSPLLTQLLFQTQIKENIKAPRHWHLCGEFTGDRWIPRTLWKVSNTGNVSIWWRHHGYTTLPCGIGHNHIILDI